MKALFDVVNDPKDVVINEIANGTGAGIVIAVAAVVIVAAIVAVIVIKKKK